MASDPQLLDMARIRARLLVARSALAEGNGAEASLALEDAIAMLNPRLDPDASHPSVDPAAVRNAIGAAHELLLAGGLQNPVEILIVQTHDAEGQTTGRTLASSAANPQDLLRLVLKNVERRL